MMTRLTQARIDDLLVRPADQVGECDRCHGEDRGLWLDAEQDNCFAYCAACWGEIFEGQGWCGEEEEDEDLDDDGQQEGEEEGEEEGFGLAVQLDSGFVMWKPAPRPKLVARPLLTGLDCLPGQGDLFATDGEGE